MGKGNNAYRKDVKKPKKEKEKINFYKTLTNKGFVFINNLLQL